MIIARRIAMILGGICVVALVIVVVVASGLLNKPEVTASPEKDKAKPADVNSSSLTECRIGAVNAYMSAQGFNEGDWVAGDDNVDHSYDELIEAGSAKFWEAITSRDKLEEFFSSSDPGAVAAQDRLVTQLSKAGVSENDALNSENWEFVQVLVESTFTGNTGFANGKAFDAGDRASSAGDASWVYIDTETCEVLQFSSAADSTSDPSEPEAVLIRVGCSNPGTGLKPPPPPPAPCPPEQVKNENGVCVTPKSSNPADYRQPGDDGKGDDVGVGKKPVVAPVTTAPESAPPPVKTEQTGGGGVVDTPTNTPGSETGVQAPGATPAPTTPPATTPNEGGSNDGEVGGF